MRRLFVAFLFLALVSPAFAQPSSGALCQSPSGQWIPLLASATGTVYPGTPPGTSLYGSSNGGVAWYPLQCDATGRLITGGLVPASTPSFSPVAGTYSGTQSVTPSCTYGTMTYNISGSAPVLTSTPISVATSETINAECSGTGYTPTFASATYVIVPIHYAFTAFVLGTPRNNFSGSAGLVFTTPSSNPPTITSLCRWNVSGNSATHTVTLYDGTTTTLVATVSIDTTLGTPATNQCVAITPATLTASHCYVVASTEVSSGDFFYDQDTTGTWDTAFAATYAPQVGNGSAGCSAGTTGFVYIPVNLTRQ